MNKVYKFKTQIIGTDKVNGAYVRFPYDVKEAFGNSGIIKVEATFDGYKYRGILAKMGTDCHIIGITKAIRVAIGKEPGDTIEVTITKDNKSRLVEIPKRLKEGLEANPLAQEFFNTLTDSQKNKFIKYITSAKKQETIAKRLEKSLNMLNTNEKMK
ncbi:YdeI/OmpD-associated family protein [Abyssisolibacter fermentans]|uniref:YdeI/OmpD-associated family protein n=1 Tax=Abyssisolibacter fermentans TaxID=1766203 RepID=UPI00083741F5|nr:YdeI/OmpD-associated family protein [Abyssisolibacter fermentans]